jgi:serine/threonine protein kinase
MTETMTGCVGTPQWMAPEVLRGEHYSEKADVYSFGVLIWEMVTGQVPHAGIPPFRLIALLANQDVRLPIPKNCSASLRRLMKKCMHKEPTKRPAFADILHEVEAWTENEVRIYSPGQRAQAEAASQPEIDSHSVYSTIN